jgi:hypothetical protein
VNFPLPTYSVFEEKNVSHANRNIFETQQFGGCCPLFRTVSVSSRFGLRDFTSSRRLVLEFVAYVLREFRRTIPRTGQVLWRQFLSIRKLTSLRTAYNPLQPKPRIVV